MDAEWQDECVGPLACAALRLPQATVFRAVPDPAALSRATTLLGGEEQAQAARFRHDADRLAYVTAHALKRLALAEALRLAPEQLAFARAETGKPLLPGHALHFSLSHCRAAVAVAISPVAPVGVDIECAGPLDVAAASAAFTTGERAQLAGMDATARPAAALRLWTLREAFAKATGAGLAAPGETHWFDLATRCIRDMAPRWGPGAAWRFHSWTIGPDLALALAIAPGEDIVTQRQR